MNQLIESVDKLPRTQTPRRVNATDRSKEEQDQEAFDKTLKKKMKKPKDGQEENIDTLIIEQTTQDSADEDQDTDNDETTDDDATVEDNNSETETSTTSGLDIKA